MTILRKVKSERERKISHDITYMWNLKNDTNEWIYKTDSQIHKLMIPKGKGEGKDKLGIWDKHIQTTKCKIDKQSVREKINILPNSQISFITSKKNGNKFKGDSTSEYQRF